MRLRHRKMESCLKVITFAITYAHLTVKLQKIVFTLYSNCIQDLWTKASRALWKATKSSLRWRNFNYCTENLDRELQRFSKINLLVCKSSPSSSNVFLIVIRNANQYFRFSIWKSDIIIGSIDDPCHAGWLPILEEMCFHTLNNQCSVCRAVAKFFG